ncbi:MAG: FtsW/RodA/SpoVE family cell cycle protein, partial [Anaerolineae bacterium]
QKLGYLPAPHTDSIFAVIGEELGFVGCIVVIGLFVLLTWRGFKIAMGAPDAFAALVACGVSCWLAFQALVNVAVMTALIPFTGVALPFVSSGGSAMLVSMAGVGLLLSVSGGKRASKRSKRTEQSKRGKQERKESRHRANLDRRWRNRGARLSRSGRRTGARR